MRAARRNSAIFSATGFCSLNTELPHTTTFAPARTQSAMFPVFTPPSISISAG